MLAMSPEVKTNPLQKANFCSRLFVWWLNPLFKIGHKWILEPDDMYSVLPEDRSQRLGEELQGHWDQEVKRAQKDSHEPSLMKAIVKCYWKSYLIWGMFTFLEVHRMPCGSSMIPRSVVFPPTARAGPPRYSWRHRGRKQGDTSPE